ncbi:MAG TPA: glycine cleavage system aminomethyltransferase GcvT [Candidatus Polarisedimenticolia bacterium]|nr:glycine cleavage system aminomethyltransferase GcvT [Candidatus Polarisedimenticolia bacterium]
MTSDPAAGPLKATPLLGIARSLGGKCVPFAGWEMAVQFSSVIDEHMAVRTRAGIFDVSHMGEIEVEGKDALAIVQRLTCNDASRLVDGQAQYSGLLNEAGGFVDDILVYRRAADRYLLVINAGNTDKDVAWVKQHGAGDADIRDASRGYAQIALQGPRAEAILQGLVRDDLRSIGYYRFIETDVRGTRSIVSRTGYTGEDGFEIYGPAGAAEDLFRALLEAGRPHGLQPCGLGARDTLRLEARMPLYGNDLDDTTTPLESGLSGIARLAKGEFIGRAALERQKKDGVTRSLAGFEMVDRGIARHDYAVRHEGRPVGRVTSGTFAPFLKKNIGLAYVPPALAVIGSRFSVVIRERDAAAVVVETPFYRRPAKASGRT